MRCSKISRESESALISLLPTLFDMLNLLSIAAQTITKGGLISERFSIWLKSQEKRCQITTLSTIHQREDARCCNFFKDLRNNEKCSEIKLPLSTYLFFVFLKLIVQEWKSALQLVLITTSDLQKVSSCKQGHRIKNYFFVWVEIKLCI